MILSYIKTSVRSMLRNKLFSLTNIVGLAASMSAGLLLISIFHDMRQYDQFHTNKDRIYRVINDYSDQNGNSYSMATGSIKAGKRIRSEISGVDRVAILQHGFNGDFKAENQSVPLKGFWSESEFLQVFSFDLLKGNKENALSKPYSIVLTETAAQKLFGTLDVLGRSVIFQKDQEENFIVTGVLKDVPKFSHLQFEILGSFSTIELNEKENQSYLSWENIWSNYVYIELGEDTESQPIQAALNHLSEEENKLNNTLSISLKLQSLNDIALGQSLENQPGPIMQSKLIWFLTGLSVIVLISACFNYTNLSIARALKRSKEIGIRKISGAKNWQLLFQFMIEAMVMSLFSLFIALILFQSIRPIFLSINPRFGILLNLDLSAEVILYFIMFAVIVGILAGLLPGLFYTRVQIISAVKNLASIKLMNKLTMRKVLLVVQYTFSLTFITSVIIIYSQYEHFINYNLGFNTKAILNIKVQDANARTLEQALNEIPDIAQTSKSFMITSVGNNYYTHVKFNNPQDSIRAWYNKVDENYISLFDLKFLAGQNFTSHLETETEVIVNEELIRRLNIGSGIPVNAIGEFVQIEGKNLRIVGVLTNFHFSTLENAIGPFIFRNTGTSFNYINVKLSSNHFHEALQEIELMWKKTGSVHPFEAYFYDDLIQRAYSEYSAMVKVIGYLAVLTVIIASLGLIGMVVYSTDARLAEVSIRKVFGAQVKQLMFMLGSGFVTLLFLSAAIAIPITYFVFERMVLRNVTYHSPIGFFELAIGGFVIMLIALVLICSYTLKAANTNPADVLKNE